MVGKEASKRLCLAALLLVMSVFVACTPGTSEPLEKEPEYMLAPPGADEVGGGAAFPFRAGDNGVLRVLAVSAPDENVVAFYRKQLADYGWQSRDDVFSASDPERAVIGWAKGDLRFRLAFWHGLEDDPRTIFAITLYRDGG